MDLTHMGTMQECFHTIKTQVSKIHSDTFIKMKAGGSSSRQENMEDPILLRFTVNIVENCDFCVLKPFLPSQRGLKHNKRGTLLDSKRHFWCSDRHNYIKKNE